jgi:carbon monoxide dehydrogenase subunit G
MSTRVSPHAFATAWLRGCLALLACAFAVSAGAQSPVRSIDVVQDGDSYVLTAQMYAPVNLAIVWDVLTDFENMEKWVPNVVDSRVVTPGEKKMMIEQKGNAKFGALSFAYTSEREIVLTPKTTILSTQVKGSMKKQMSLMTITPDGEAGTKLQYKLELVPSFLAARVVSADFLKHEITEQFTAIIGEMVKRKK